MPKGYDIKIDPAVVRDMYLERCMTCEEIGARIGVSGAGVWAFLKRNHIPTRSRHGLRGPQWKPRHRTDQTPIGGTIDRHGYIWLRIGKLYPGADKRGYMLRSRYVWQEATGDVLCSKDIIHHRNENKQDDRFENLQRLTRAEHRSLHWKLKKQQREMRALESA